MKCYLCNVDVDETSVDKTLLEDDDNVVLCETCATMINTAMLKQGQFSVH